MEVAFTGSAPDFLEKIKDNPESWTQGEKVVELVGVITAKDAKGISINESIRRKAKNKRQNHWL